MGSSRENENYSKGGFCMNYHDEPWIYNKLNEHLEYAETIYPSKNVIGIFLRGSQNYGLDDENSDVDTMLLITPTIDDICLGRKPVSTTLVMPNDEHIDVKDIRLMRAQILKQSPQFMECLMTPYSLIHPHAALEWLNFKSHDEYYFNYDKKKMIKAMRGYAHEKHHALSHPYPSRMEYINKYGYDPKQLMHLARYKELVKNFTLGKPFPDILICDDSEIEAYLRELKSGKFDLSAAQRIADEILKTTEEYTNLFVAHEPDIDETKTKMIEEFLDKDIGAFIRTSLKREFEEENS